MDGQLSRISSVADVVVNHSAIDADVRQDLIVGFPQTYACAASLPPPIDSQEKIPMRRHNQSPFRDSAVLSADRKCVG